MGSIIKRKKSYQAQISAYKNGKNNRITRTFRYKTDAKKWITKMEGLKDKNIQLYNWSKSFAEYYESYIYDIKKREVNESTFKNYLGTLKFVKEHTSHIKIKHVCYDNIQRLIDMYSESRAKSTAKDFKNKISSAIKHAYAVGLIERDFTSSLRFGGYETNKRNVVLSFAEYKKLLNYVKSNHSEINTFIYTIMKTGLRRSECLALRPFTISKDKIIVKESISPTSDDKSLKTKSSYREIPITYDLYKRLKSLPIRSDGYLFNINYFHQSQDLQKILDKLNIQKTTIHGLRATYASILYARTKDEMYVTQLLGHKDFSITKNYYIDIIEENKNELDNKVIDFMSSL